MAASEPVVLYGAKDQVARIVVNRPGARNALSRQVVRELDAALARAAADPEARVVVLTGAGEEAFATGGEPDDARAEGLLPGHEERGAFASLLRAFRSVGKPVIARVNGECLSDGLALALACDLGIASNDATFGTPEVLRGIMPMRVMALLVRNCGRKKALELILTGMRISAREAERLGLVNHTVPVEELDARVNDLAADLASRSPGALRLGRDAFYGSADLELGAALDYLQTLLTLNLASEDAGAGLAARVQPRSPAGKEPT
jgi:enoyl-CoA hydratase